jgi:hypothetical protein
VNNNSLGIGSNNKSSLAVSSTFKVTGPSPEISLESSPVIESPGI